MKRTPPNFRLASLRVRKLLWALRTTASRKALRQGVVGSLELLPLLLAVPKPPRTVIDVGANCGQFLLVASHLWPGAEFHAFEPGPAVDRLRRVTVDMPSSIAVHAQAVSSHNGHAALYVTKDDDNSSLHEPAPELMSLRTGAQVSHQIRVPTVRLDTALERSCSAPILLKIDVQGHEFSVIEGLGSLADSIDAVVVELGGEEFYRNASSAREVHSALLSMGLQMAKAVNHPWGQADRLYIRDC